MLLAGLTPELMRAAGWVFLFGVIVVSRDLPLRLALPLVLVKLAIPVFYFAANPAGTLHLIDDMAYFHWAIRMQHLGLDPVSIVTDPRAFFVAGKVVGSKWQIGYSLWNLGAVSALGPHYFAPVLCNVGLTFLSGWFFFRILRESGLPRAYCRCALAFFLLHWDTVVWSSFLNLKEVATMMLTMAFLWSCIRFSRKPDALLFLAMMAALALLFFLRFYAPVILIAALLARFLGTRGAFWARMAASSLTAAAAVVLILKFNGGQFPGKPDFAAIPAGIPHFVLTPLPWNPGYDFLRIPAVLHLLLAVPAALAVPLLWHRGPGARLVLIHTALVVVCYAAVPDLNGPRHRVQVGFMFIWLQFHALWTLARYAAGPWRHGDARVMRRLGMAGAAQPEG